MECDERHHGNLRKNRSGRYCSWGVSIFRFAKGCDLSQHGAPASNDWLLYRTLKDELSLEALPDV
jgi:hypothetical protein